MNILISRWRVCSCWLGLFAAAAVVCFIFVQARHARSQVDPAKARKKGEPIPVRTSRVSEVQADEVIGATAVTLPFKVGSVRIGLSHGLSSNAPLSDTVVKAVYAHEGDYVHRGQVLLDIDTKILAEVAKQQRSAYEAAKASLERTQEEIKYNQKIRELDLARAKAETKYRVEDLDNRKQELDAIRKLYRDKGASLFDLFTAISAYFAAGYTRSEADDHLERAKDALPVGIIRDKESLAKALSDSEAAAINLRSAEYDVSRSRLESPLDGIVDYGSRAEPVAGEVIVLNSVIGQVLQLDPVLVRMDFPQDRLDDLSLGQQAEVVLDSFSQDTFLGKVVHISPQVNPSLRVLPVDIELRNPKNRIKAGISGFVRMRLTKKVLTVPTAAVLKQGDKTMVFCVQEGRARTRQFRAGPIVRSGLQEVRSGLASDEEVIIFHNFYAHADALVPTAAYLKENDLVNTDWRRWARRQ